MACNARETRNRRTWIPLTTAPCPPKSTSTLFSYSNVIRHHYDQLDTFFSQSNHHRHQIICVKKRRVRACALRGYSTFRTGDFFASKLHTWGFKDKWLQEKDSIRYFYTAFRYFSSAFQIWNFPVRITKNVISVSCRVCSTRHRLVIKCYADRISLLRTSGQSVYSLFPSMYSRNRRWLVYTWSKVSMPK